MAEAKKLLEGYRAFYKKHFVEGKGALFDGLERGQSPKTMVIACSDSRVDPAILTNADPGDMFVVRNVANLVPPYQAKWDSCHGTSAAIEYAVKVLNVQHIVVMGHSDCGGIKALLDETLTEDLHFVFDWVNILREAKSKIPKKLSKTESCDHCSQESIRISLKNLKTFSWVAERVQSGKLKLHGWFFSFDGKLSILDAQTDTFKENLNT